jgi:uncharacterized Fe-S cluster-containing MiaB family protein
MSDIIKEIKNTNIEIQIGNETIRIDAIKPAIKKGQSFDELKKALKKAAQEDLLKPHASDV